MAVIISEMNMPDCCIKCELWNDLEYMCGYIGDVIVNPRKERGLSCPLKTVEDSLKETEEELIKLSVDHRDVEAYNSFNAGVQYTVGYAIGSLRKNFKWKPEEKE